MIGITQSWEVLVLAFLILRISLIREGRVKPYSAIKNAKTTIKQKKQ